MVGSPSGPTSDGLLIRPWGDVCTSRRIMLSSLSIAAHHTGRSRAPDAVPDRVEFPFALDRPSHAVRSGVSDRGQHGLEDPVGPGGTEPGEVATKSSTWRLSS